MSKELIETEGTITRKEIKQAMAYTTYLELRQRMESMSLTYLEIGRLLKLIRDEKLYKYLGNGGYDTFLEFINNPEISISQGTVYNYIRTYEFYILKLDMNPDDVMRISTPRLIAMIPVLKDKTIEEAKEEILQMGALTHTDYLQQRTEKGYEQEKPNLYLDKLTNKYILEFREFNMLKIYNKDKKEIIYGQQDL